VQGSLRLALLSLPGMKAGVSRRKSDESRIICFFT
jgi:hypothetical protein